MPAKFVPRVRKQKAKARLRANSQVQSSQDSNSLEIIPAEHDLRKAALRAELRSQQPSTTISSKKAKRLDHYIETKLKKEENLDLIKKLAAQKVDTSLLRSAKNLGRGGDTRRETLRRALEETERGINVSEHQGTLFERRDVRRGADDYPEIAPQTESHAVETASVTAPAVASSTAVPLIFGSGLKRPLDVHQDGQPRIKKRKRRRVAPSTVQKSVAAYSSDDSEPSDDEDDEDDEWNGFSDEENRIVVAVDSVDRNPQHEDMSSAEDSVGVSDEDSSGHNDDESSASSLPDNGQRSSIFKEWAEQQRNQALGYVPSNAVQDQSGLSGARILARKADRAAVVTAPALGPLAPSQETPAVSTSVKRTDEIQESRSKLPVVQEEQRIMEAIHGNKITIICGATGSGKTTQVPQMMFESGYGSYIGTSKTSSDRRAKGMIGVTQPRRVAATSVAQRVADEMGELKGRVGHQVRFDASVGMSTAIKFMTDGILLREVANDFTLSKYSAIVIDEAHERSTNTDILIGLLSRVVDLRDELTRDKPDQHYPLKLVIMSATMRVEDFTKNATLFRQGSPPIIQAEGRQFSVVNHFSRQTRRNYLDEMFHKITKGHRKLPKGGMLVFLTGQAEILSLMKRLQLALTSDAANVSTLQRTATAGHPDPEDDVQLTDDNEIDDDMIHGLSDEEDIRDEFDIEGDQAIEERQNVHILPLYSQLPSQEQQKVFQPPPEGSRQIILATNVAETSLTIPGIRYVFDCGRVKEKQYDTRTGVQTFEVQWISKASAMQRAGRAGRTGPGHCYRLYSSAVYERDFEEHTVPEILRSPVENVALMVKGVDFPNVASFPFPTPPDRHALAMAEDLLKYLGAVDKFGKITQTGRVLSNYPLSPRFGRMLMLAANHNLLAHTIALVCALAIPELLVPEAQVSPKLQSHVHDGLGSESDESSRRVQYDDDQASEKLRSFKRARTMLSRWDNHADAITLLTAFVLCSKPALLSSRCAEFFVREKGMTEALDLRSQLIRIVQSQHPDLRTEELTALPPLKDAERAKLKYILAAGFADQVAIRLDLLSELALPERKPRKAIEVPYVTLLPSDEAMVYIHPSSILARLGVNEVPQFIIYEHLSRAAPKVIGREEKGGKVRMHPLTTISAKQVVSLLDDTELLEVGKPIGKVTMLDDGRREAWVGLTLKGAGGVRWGMGSRKERQVRRKGEWRTEEVLS